MAISSPLKIIEAMKIFSKYECYKDYGYFLSAEHDIIYSDAIKDIISVDSEDGQKLIELGWFYSDEYDCWSIFT